MPKYLYTVEYTTEMTRVPLSLKSFERFFFQGWRDHSKKAFLQQHVGKLTTYLMSKDEEARFRNIQNYIRSAYDKYAIPHVPGSTTRYFTEKSREDFKKEFEKYREQYFDLVDDFCKTYDKKRDKFLDEAVQFPDTNSEKERLYKKLKADIIPEKNFREKFALNFIPCGRIDLDDPEHIIQSNRSLGKALSIANELVKSWSKGFSDHKGKIHYKSLSVWDDRLRRMLDYDVNQDPDFKSIIEDFKAIVVAEGMGNTTKDNLKNLKDAIEDLAYKYNVTDMLR